MSYQSYTYKKLYLVTPEVYNKILNDVSEEESNELENINKMDSSPSVKNNESNTNGEVSNNDFDDRINQLEQKIMNNKNETETLINERLTRLQNQLHEKKDLSNSDEKDNLQSAELLKSTSKNTPKKRQYKPKKLYVKYIFIYNYLVCIEIYLLLSAFVKFVQTIKVLQDIGLGSVI